MMPPRFDPGRLENWWLRSRLLWTERSLREQVLLGGLAATAIVALLLIAVISPLRAVRADALANIRNADLLEARIRAGGPELGQGGKFRRGTASAIVTDSVSAARLTVQRIEPEGGNLRVVLGDAPFPQVLQWIAEIEQSSRLRVINAEIERKGAPGVVSTSLVVSG